jgi:hypothetical protein
VGLELQGVLQALQHPLGNFSRLRRFAGRTLTRLLVGPEVPVRNGELEPLANELARNIASLANNVERLLRLHQEEIIDRQCQVARIGDAATEIYVSACTLRRLDALLRQHPSEAGRQSFSVQCGKHYLRTASRRIRQHLAALWDNDDEATLDVARRALEP